MKTNTIPNHIAFIMDGNRRWARAHKLSLLNGHKAGAESIEPLVVYGLRHEIKYLTFWAFSSENWKRGKMEVEFLLQVFRTFLKNNVVDRLIENGGKFRFIGDYQAFPVDIVTGLEDIIERSKNNSKIHATFALNYGGKQEIIRAVNLLLAEGKKNVEEQTFTSYLYTKDIPDPDLIIRTGGEQRLSGFLPWQGAYSELYFTDVYWPDFHERELEKAIEEYSQRERRFGK